MLRKFAVATLTVLVVSSPALAQNRQPTTNFDPRQDTLKQDYNPKQEYPAYVYEEMVPTGPYMRRMEEAQPVPGARPSHWGAISKDGQFRAGMPQYGTDAQRRTPSYARTHSLTPPVRDGRAPANAGGELTVSTPRAVTTDQGMTINRGKSLMD